MAMLFIRFLICAVFVLVSRVQCIDLPTFYRAPYFAGFPQKDQRDWATFVNVRYDGGSARHGSNVSHRSTALLSTWGDVDVSKLALNLQNIASKPVTNSFLGTSGTITDYNFTGSDGHIDLNARFRIHEIVLEAQQNLLHGVFLKVYLPFRDLKIDRISIHNKTSSSNTNAVAFQSFLDNNFNTVLSENGYAALTTPFSKGSIADPAVFLGWQGYAAGNFGMCIQDLIGELLAGCSIPVGAQDRTDRVATLPLGYDGHFTIFGRGNAEMHIFKMFSVGLNAGVAIFIPRTDLRRMKTSAAQSGIIELEFGKAELNPGALWQLGGFAKLDRPIGGLTALIGYSFTAQERNKLTVKDSNFLSTFIAADNVSTNPTRTTKDVIVNSNNTLSNWFVHTLHFLLEYNVRAHIHSAAAPNVSLYYNLPIDSRLTWKTDMLGGGVGFSAAWKI
jgi:hypothetical protein